MRLALLAGGLMVLGGMAFGDEKRVIQSPPAPQEAGQVPLWSLDLKGDYTFGSRIMKAGDFGSQAEYHFNLDALRNLSLFGKYYLQIGVDYERFAFSRSNDIFPYAMSSVSAEITISYWTGDVFFPLLKLEPGIYFTRDYVTRNSLDIPMRVATGIKINDNIHLVLGLAADPLAQTPALPIDGVNWKINDKLNFRAVFPKPRLSYIPNEALELFVLAKYKVASSVTARQTIVVPTTRCWSTANTVRVLGRVTHQRKIFHLKPPPAGVFCVTLTTF